MKKLNLIAMAALTMFAAHGSANATLPLTLNTSWLDANATLSFSTEAKQALELTGIQTSAAGNATLIGDGVINLPISQLKANIGLLPPTLTPVAGSVAGSIISFKNSLSGDQVALTDLKIDFKTEMISGYIEADGKKTFSDLFSFDVIKPLTLTLAGGISLTETLGNLRLTTAAADSFAARIGLPSFLASALTSIDFGTVKADIKPWFRQAVVPMSTQVSAVPEPAQAWLVLVGLIALTMASRKVGAQP